MLKSVVVGVLVALAFLPSVAEAQLVAGDLLWDARFGEPGELVIPSGGAIDTNDDAVFVAGSIGSSFPGDAYVRAYDAHDGGLLWSDVVATPCCGDWAQGVTATAERVYAVGMLFSRPVIRAYDSHTGALAWQQRVFEDRESGFLTGPFDSVVVHRGRVVAGGGNYTWTVQAYDAETGVPLWGDRGLEPNKPMSPGRSGFTIGGRVLDIAAADGRVFATGRGRREGTGWNWIRAYDVESGAHLWEAHTQAHDEGGQAFGVAVDGDRVITAGRHRRGGFDNPVPNAEDWMIRVFDTATGRLEWQRRIDDGGNDFASDVVARDGRAFVAGRGGEGCSFETVAPDNCDFIVRAYSLQNGTLLWEDRLDLAPTDSADSIAVEQNRVTAVGTVAGANSCLGVGAPQCDMITRTYDAASGTLLWQDQADFGFQDIGFGVATRGDNVFVSGAAGSADDLFSRGVVRAYSATGGSP